MRDEHETSIILAIAPDSVRMAHALPDYGNGLDEPQDRVLSPGAIFGPIRSSGPDYSETGVRGAIRRSPPARRARDAVRP